MRLLFEKSKTDLPMILLELDTSNFSIKKAYIYGNSQIIAQYDGNPFSANKYFYLHDRLGSIRQIIDCQADVVSLYTYSPFGETIETDGTFSNQFRFTGQWYDNEISWYYLRARMYDPHLSRFTGRDPILGKFEEPLTLHKYLYCGNDPVNKWDPSGQWLVQRWAGHPELMLVSMDQFDFSGIDIAYAIAGNVWTDYRKDHTLIPWRRNDVPHFTPGDEKAALAHAFGAMELAVWYRQKGMDDVAMMMLGTALHTIQDKYCHSDAGAGWWEHRKGIWDDEGFLPNPDNPWLHPKAYRSAYSTTINWLSVFGEAAKNDGAYSADLDRSGGIGDGFIYSSPKDSFYDVLENLFDKEYSPTGLLP
jgi:RHS repeat-associated protein